MLSRRSFLKRMGSAVAAVGVGAKFVATLPEPTAEIEALDGFSQLIPFDMASAGDYTIGMIYYNVDGTWQLATHEDWDGVMGIAISPTEIVCDGQVQVIASQQDYFL